MQISMTIEEACSAIGLGRTKLYEAINSGALKAKKYGKRTIILKCDIEAFLSQLEPYSDTEKEVPVKIRSNESA